MPDDDPMIDFSARLPASEHRATTTIAARESRTLAGQIRHYVREGLRRDGVLPSEPAPESTR